MRTETKMAVDPTTGEKYAIELPDSEGVKQEILKTGLSNSWHHHKRGDRKTGGEIWIV